MTPEQTSAPITRWILCEGDLLHILSVAIGATFVSVEDATARLGLRARSVKQFDTSQVSSDDPSRDTILRLPKWEMDESELLRTFNLATDVKHTTVHDGATRFRLRIWPTSTPC